MKCPRCEHENRATAKFCEACAASLNTVSPDPPNAPSYAELKSALREALEQQMATAEVLQIISRSPTDLQPVLDTVVKSAARFCGADDAIIFQLEGADLRLAAHFGPVPARLGLLLRVVPGTVVARAVLEGRAIHTSDVQSNPEEYPETSAVARKLGYRTQLSVPLLREGTAIGAVSLRRSDVNPFTDKQITLLQTFADQAVIAIENVRLFTELREKNAALTEALDQQTATSEILRVISSSPTDMQPVFETIVRNAAQLCSGFGAALFRTDGVMLEHPVNYGVTPDVFAEIARHYPMRLDASTAVESSIGKAIHTRSVVQITDTEDPSVPSFTKSVARAVGFRSQLSVPMLKDGEPVGGIVVVRREVGRFTEAQIALLQTFADQAVIAIENVRLFNETKEALERQIATSEILRVISSSPTDLQPVFDAIAERAARLCEAQDASLYQVDGNTLRHVASHGDVRSFAPGSRRSITRGSTSGRAILSGQTIHIPDILAERSDEWPDIWSAVERQGIRTVLTVPLLQQGTAIGALVIRRTQVRPFTDTHIRLLETFADQAVIAIENVRLFTELQTSNRDLTTALDKQTATSDILRVISRSQTDIRPVFDTIIASAVRLLGGHTCGLTRVTGDQVELVALTSIDAAADAPVRAAFPQSLRAVGAHPQAIRDRVPLNVADAHTDARLAEGERVFAGIRGFRSWVVVPMLRDDVTIGSIGVTRRDAGGFTADEIALLQTFADQAVIAIENVRLFNELEARNRDLTATSEVLQVISRSPTDVQPVFDTIIRNAVQICGARLGVFHRFDGEQLHLVAHHGHSLEALEVVRRAYPMRPDRTQASGRAILDRAVTEIPDAREDPAYDREMALAMDWRSLLAVPLLRVDGSPTGVIVIQRQEAGHFATGQVELLKTFADQAVIAIENVRLFKELQTSNRDLTTALDQQTATSEILRVISRSQTELQPVFDAIVDSAARLCHADIAGLFRLEDGQLNEISSRSRLDPNFQERMRRVFPRPLDDSTHMGRALLQRRLIHVADLADPSAPPSAVQLQAFGFRTHLAVPMLRGGEPIGGLSMLRRTAGLFSEDQVQLLQTFADQAVIAIENARLLTELQARTQELTRSVDQLTALGEVGRAVSSTLDLETVLTTIVSRAVQLSGLDGGVVFEYDDGAEEFVLRVATETGGALAEARRNTRIRKGEGVLGRTAIALEPVQVPDIAVPGAYEGRLRENLIESGVRAILAVPMVREGRLIGCLGVTRNRPGEFPAEIIELLRTFATQSALAIQNARLFREIEQKSRELEAASRHKSEFLANMSHELRTPLNAVIGFSEVLSERMFGELNEKQDEYLKDIHASGQHLLSLINDILDLSKIEAGRMELEVTDFDLPMTIDNALMLVRERAARRSIALHTRIDERLGHVQADERKVRQVLLNLLSNAIKFTPAGGRIHVEARSVNESIEVSVTDTGVGIAPEDQEAVFEEFRQVGTADKKVEGTGLGLALSRKFIELHGGKIWVKSQVGAGSTFTFTVPVRRGE